MYTVWKLVSTICSVQLKKSLKALVLEKKEQKSLWLSPEYQIMVICCVDS